MAFFFSSCVFFSFFSLIYFHLLFSPTYSLQLPHVCTVVEQRECSFCPISLLLCSTAPLTQPIVNLESCYTQSSHRLINNNNKKWALITAVKTILTFVWPPEGDRWRERGTAPESACPVSNQIVDITRRDKHDTVPSVIPRHRAFRHNTLCPQI